MCYRIRWCTHDQNAFFWQLRSHFPNIFCSFFCSKKRLPFSGKTPIGYLLCFVFVTLGAYCALSCIVPTISFSIGLAILSRAFIEKSIIDLKELGKKARKNSGQAKQLFCSIVQDFSDLKELSGKRHPNFCAHFFIERNFSFQYCWFGKWCFWIQHHCCFCLVTT